MKIGFACKIQEAHDKALKGYNTSTTTLTWLNSQKKDVAVERLYKIIKNNLERLDYQMSWLIKNPTHLQMMRITSDLFPVYTHESWMWFYFQQDVVDLLSKELMYIGERARKHNIKLSFHPGQFCVLASDNEQVVENSLQEFEYHCDIIRYMGYGRKFQDFKCNVHISGKQGPQGVIKALKKLSPEARNCLTIENAEFTHGIDASLELEKHCALVLDIHHHWIMTGEYIQLQDPKVQRVIESWRGMRPTLHYSLSRENVLQDHDTNKQPNLQELLEQGFTRSKLRAHSDYMWNNACNQWAGTFLPEFDIMCEAKQKNLASFLFAKDLKI